MIPTMQLLKTNRTGLVIALLFSFCLIVIEQTRAAAMSCRSDPIVDLSDGTRLQFNIEIETALDNVIGIRYQLHVPVGVEINRINYTPSWARSREIVELIADQPPGSYQIHTMVDTGSMSVPVTVDAMMVAQSNHGEGSTRAVITGHSGQHITIAF
jgi:hypothetical protein